MGSFLRELWAEIFAGGVVSVMGTILVWFQNLHPLLIFGLLFVIITTAYVILIRVKRKQWEREVKNTNGNRLELLQAQWAQQEKLEKRDRTIAFRKPLLEDFNELLDKLTIEVEAILTTAKDELKVTKKTLKTIWGIVHSDRQSQISGIGEYRWLFTLRNAMNEYGISLMSHITESTKIKEINSIIDKKLHRLADPTLRFKTRDFRNFLYVIYDERLFNHFTSRAKIGDKFHDIDIEIGLQDWISKDRTEITERIQYLENADDVQ